LLRTNWTALALTDARECTDIVVLIMNEDLMVKRNHGTRRVWKTTYTC